MGTVWYFHGQEMGLEYLRLSNLYRFPEYGWSSTGTTLSCWGCLREGFPLRMRSRWRVARILHCWSEAGSVCGNPGHAC